MSRIGVRFEALRRQGRTALIPFVTAGDPAPAETAGILHLLVRAGADLVELGVPFSDPMADGPVIQRASERALSHHVNLRRVFELVREFRRDDNTTPLVLMGYLNPIECMGYEAFAAAAQDAGVDGVLIVDLPPEESTALAGILREHGLDPIFLVAPNSTEERIATIAAAASGFIYYVSLKGVTGAGNLDVTEVGEKIACIRRFTTLPIGVGFGIKDGESAVRVGAAADAVIVGSAVVQRIAQWPQGAERAKEEIVRLVGEIRAALDRVGHGPSASEQV